MSCLSGILHSAEDIVRNQKNRSRAKPAERMKFPQPLLRITNKAEVENSILNPSPPVPRASYPTPPHPHSIITYYYYYSVLSSTLCNVATPPQSWPCPSSASPSAGWKLFDHKAGTFRYSHVSRTVCMYVHTVHA